MQTSQPVLTEKRILAYRSRAFRTLPGERVKTCDEAVAFVNERGFVFFWPITGIVLPSLWAAVAGDRPVADAHDDPGHVTWSWKDSLLGERRWYYAKVLRKKATMIALDVAPSFYALSENYGSPEEDYLTLYEQGRLTQEARVVYEVLLDEGPLDTVALRKAAHMTSRSSDSRFNRALVDLQADFKILPVGVTQAGAWHYAFAYDIVARHYPDLPEQAHAIRERQAQRKLVDLYFRSVGAAQVRDVARLFGWGARLANRIIDALVEAGALRRGLQMENQAGEWIALAELTDSE
ncbi:MAG: winged helix DNA-binding domain-containing protein [Anaerolineales bacterium]|nr:winged helix DNA-binding domain-containing protein [Anaerolineales bacterium]